MNVQSIAPPGAAHRKRIGLALAILALLSACKRTANDADAPVPVIAVAAQAADAGSSSEFPGDVHARYEMPLSFRIAGKLVARHVNPGDRVKQGAILAELDPGDTASTLDQAQAALAAAQSRYVFASQQRTRDEAQYKQDLISQQQLEQTRDASVAAQAGRDQAQQQVTLAQHQLHYTTLRADHDGTVTRLQADVGQVLAAGQAVCDFAWAGEREVQVDVPESRIGELAVGQAATVTLPALPGKTFAARVREIAGAADPQTRTYLLKLAFDAPSPGIALGMSANVSWHASGQAPVHVVRIPASALFHQGAQPAVWVIDPKTATLALRPVTVVRYGERDALLGTGLVAGERIVAQGVHVVAVGEKVVAIAPPHAEDAPQ